MKKTEKNQSFVTACVFDGVDLVSRYDVPQEYADMMKAVKRIGVKHVRRIFCDSKAGSVYDVTTKVLVTDALCAQIDHAFDGHNGVTVEGPDGRVWHIDPRWEEDFGDIR